MSSTEVGIKRIHRTERKRKDPETGIVLVGWRDLNISKRGGERQSDLPCILKVELTNLASRLVVSHEEKINGENEVGVFHKEDIIRGGHILKCQGCGFYSAHGRVDMLIRRQGEIPSLKPKER